jgi:L-ascorbate metabolism protein UlaG (beta-lactamase superfamily)
MNGLRLRRNVQIAVEYDDRTSFGSPVTERIDARVREVFAPVMEFAEQHGFGDFVAAAPSLLTSVVQSPGFARIAITNGAGTWRIRPEVLFPDAVQAPPRWLSMACADTGKGFRLTVPAGLWPGLHALIAMLSGSGGLDTAEKLDPDRSGLLAVLRQNELVEQASQASSPQLDGADLTFIGHNTVVVRSGATRIVVDPFMLPGGSAYPADYQPLQLRDVGPIDAILVTHSHRDHFDAASLLQFPPETRVIVPRVERETLLQELGFTDVTELEWGHGARVGDIEVQALPFYGEQPTETEVLHPEVRNAGNTYFVRTPTFSAAFLADSRRDGRGDIKQVAAETRLRLGAADVVFSGYRGWVTYPAQLLFSSVARFLLFVPPHLWGVRQQLMSSPEEAVDIAECWGARYLAPYADGGAPWHWQMGLGPRLDDDAAEVRGFDPFPERVIEAALYRTCAPDGAILPSTARPFLLHPGDSLLDVSAVPRVFRLARHTWPYEDAHQLT